ncbi:MAG: CooT family nickel-binding protein [Thermincola sp.]|jgi:predicted RNA-binding protein|nr:CooT family nickel-binding protein [Thermincola sp.]
MCEANAYVKNNGNEELLLESVDKITPEDNMLILENIYGQKKTIRGKIVEMALVEHRIVIERT